MKKSSPILARDECVFRIAAEIVDVMRRHPRPSEAFDGLEVARVLFRGPDRKEVASLDQAVAGSPRASASAVRSRPVA